jgi:hypothetical protein
MDVQDQLEHLALPGLRVKQGREGPAVLLVLKGLKAKRAPEELQDQMETPAR